MRLALWLAAALSLAPGLAPAQEAPEVGATATASVDEVGVGERFHVDVSVVGPEATRWRAPDQAGDDSVELVRLPNDPENPLPAGTFRYRALAFALDEVTVPAISIGYRLPGGEEGELTTEPIPLKIRSLLPRAPEEQTLADIRPPQPLAIGLPFWIGLGLLAAALIAAAVLVWRRTRRPKPAAPPPPPTPADVEALAALDRLAAGDHGSRGAWREYYIELAQIAKRYLERRLHAPVLEMTTSEAGAFLRDHPDGQSVFGALKELAGAADQVKFARAGTQAEERLRPTPPPPAREPGMASRRQGGGAA